MRDWLPTKRGSVENIVGGLVLLFLLRVWHDKGHVKQAATPSWDAIKGLSFWDIAGIVTVFVTIAVLLQTVRVLRHVQQDAPRVTAAEPDAVIDTVSRSVVPASVSANERANPHEQSTTTRSGYVPICKVFSPNRVHLSLEYPGASLFSTDLQCVVYTPNGLTLAANRRVPLALLGWNETEFEFPREFGGSTPLVEGEYAVEWGQEKLFSFAILGGPKYETVALSAFRI